MQSKKFSLQALEPRTLFTTSFTVAFADNGQFAQYHADIQRILLAAGAEWASKLGGSGTIDIQVSISASIPTAQTESVVTVPIGTSQNGFELDQQGAAYEMLTGIDPNGSDPDVRIEIGANYLTNDLWFDPDPTTRTTPVPANKIDAYSVLLHELAHGFGFNGFRDSTTGALTGDAESTFDQWIRQDTSGHLYFVGPNAKAAYNNAAIPLTAGNAFHVGNQAPGLGSDLVPDLMNGVMFVRGTRYDISNVDLGILQDTMQTTTASSEDQSRMLALTSKKPLSYIDSSGNTVTLTLKGPGSGTITFLSPGNADPDTIALTDTTKKSTLTIKSKALTTIDNLNDDSTIGTIDAKNVSITEGMISPVSSKLNLASLSNALVDFGSAAAMTISVPSVTDSTLSAGNIKSLKTYTWSGNTLNVGNLSSFSANSVGDSTFRTANVGSFSASSITSSRLYAGASSALTGLASSSTDFLTSGSIKSLSIKKTFSSTIVSAANLGKMALGFVDTTSSDVFGLSSETISSVTGSTPSGKLKLKKNQEFDSAEFDVNVLI